MSYNPFAIDSDLGPLGWFDEELAAGDASGGGDTPVNVGPGTYNVTGSVTSLRRGLVVAALAGAYALTGAPAKLVVGRTANAATTTYSLSGSAATKLRTYVLSAGTGAYVLSGVAATFQAPTPDKTLAVDPGSYTLTGFAAGVLRGSDVAAGTSTYVLSGAAATLRWAGVGSAQPDTYGVGGRPATLIYSGAVMQIIRVTRGNRQVPRFRTNLDDSGLSTDT